MVGSFNDHEPDSTVSVVRFYELSMTAIPQSVSCTSYAGIRDISRALDRYSTASVLVDTPLILMLWAYICVCLLSFWSSYDLERSAKPTEQMN